ncbi:Dot/Icm T4SS effector Zinc-dependent metalloprotease LegP [Sphaerotilus microaerophilus]|jgi:astacin|uniref:Peptidase M12A domain-containing protein n=1 Tax=Sphaerotilus microaerophilus TaxID=2914710 RepID=A0ABN6PNK3_9BURK|nr:Dot/Icm T4SS effector Zinc-dependent metalloprotease LegP [Sphaerotilus sp. FB-5]BDI05598.1 hypothetical protein CATMQ487_25680 [Sphaerotilus sp. FB-5]
MVRPSNPTQPSGHCSGEYCSSDEVRTGFFQGVVMPRRAMQYAVVDGMAVFEGDIILGSAEEMELVADAVRGGTAAPADLGELARGCVITGQNFRWPNATIPYTIDPALPNQQRITDAIAHWQTNTRIRFVLRTAANAGQYPNYLTFRPGNGCSSYVGMRGGQQFINLADGCSTGNTIHEIGHTVGLWHEQSREDRDNFVRIEWQNITPGVEHNFNQHITDGDDIGAYDFGSLMHYGATAFSKNGQPTIVTLGGQAIGQRNGLSPNDIATVHAIYPPPKVVVKDINDLSQVKRRKDTKDTKDRIEQKLRKDTKDRTDGKLRKDVKDRKDRDMVQPPFPPVPPIRDVQPIEDRIAELEKQIQQLGHFIDPSLRPDMSLSPLSDEADAEASELDAIGQELQQLADQFKTGEGG